jgi:hypothetical protein
VISKFQPTINNYYKPLYSYAHYEELDMVRDKKQAALAMCVRMSSLRTGAIKTAGNPTPTGRGGGRGGGGGYGRGDGNTTTTSGKVDKEVPQNY